MFYFLFQQLHFVFEYKVWWVSVNSFLFKKRLQCIPSILPSPVTPMFEKFVSSFPLQDLDIIFLQRTQILPECNRQVYIHYKIVLEQKRLSVWSYTQRTTHICVRESPWLLAFCHSWLTGKECLWFLPWPNPSFCIFLIMSKWTCPRWRTGNKSIASKKRTQNNQQCTHSNVHLTTVYSSRREKHC